MAQQIVGLDVGRDHAYVAIIEASFRRAVLRGVKTVRFAAELPEAERWQQIRAALPSALDSVVLAIDGKLVSARSLDFPFGDLRKAQSAIDFELEGQIPYAIEDVVSAHYVTEHTQTQTQVLAATTLRGPQQQMLATMAAAGIEPRALALPSAALVEYVPASAPGAVGVISLGGSESHLAIARGGLRFVRTLRVGGDEIDAHAARVLGVTAAEVRAAKHRHGRILGPQDEAPEEIARLSQALTKGMAPLLAALTTTFRALAGPDMPTRLVLTGGLSRLPGLDAYLQARFGIPVTLLDVRGATAALPGGPDAVGPEYAVALGMALAHFRHGREMPLNFRRGALAYHGDIQLYRGQLTRLAVGLAAVLVLAIGAATVRYSMLVAEGHDLDRGFADATQRIVGREIRDPTAALATLRQAPGAEGVVIPSYSAASLLEMMSKAVGSDVDVQFDELDLRVDATGGQAERLTGKGEAASFEATEQLRNALRRDVCVQEAEVSKLRKNATGARVEFSLALKVACPAGVPPGSQQTALPATADAGAAATAAPPPASP